MSVTTSFNPRLLKLCGWSGAACIVVMAIGFVGFAGFIPPPSPADSAAKTARLFADNRGTIRIGMII